MDKPRHRYNKQTPGMGIINIAEKAEDPKTDIVDVVEEVDKPKYR